MWAEQETKVLNRKEGVNSSRGSDINPETPKQDITNQTSAKTSPASTSFLPELNSTPPMPTFQRANAEHAQHALPPKRFSQHRPESTILPPIADPGHLLAPKPRPSGAAGMKADAYRPKDTAPLPKKWSKEHDRAICYMDTKGYPIEIYPGKLKEYFPELKELITTAMLEKRLRQLDQDPQISYFSDALAAIAEQDHAAQQLRSTTSTPKMRSMTNLKSSPATGQEEGSVLLRQPRVKVSSESAV